jgi:2-polyprenyl-3-methyl-5-hydroxy-6-metoxy-1,4-benzoquinol methylase
MSAAWRTKGCRGITEFDDQDPDGVGSGLTADDLDPVRYDHHSNHPLEVAGIMHAYMPAGVRVLDVGCGTGSLAGIANRGRGNQVVGIEPDPVRAAFADAHGVDIHCGMLDGGFVAENGLFDVVILADVLEHVAAPAEFLDLVLTALKPEGELFISVPNVAHWSVRLGLLVGRFDYEAYGIMDVTHLRWFTEKTLRMLLAAKGLEVVELRRSAGVGLKVYRTGLLGGLPRGVLLPIVRRLTLTLPRFFGCQHVVRTRRASL